MLRSFVSVLRLQYTRPKHGDHSNPNITQKRLISPKVLPSFLPSVFLKSIQPFLERKSLLSYSNHTTLDTFPALNGSLDMAMFLATPRSPERTWLSLVHGSSLLQAGLAKIGVRAMYAKVHRLALPILDVSVAVAVTTDFTLGLGKEIFTVIKSGIDVAYSCFSFFLESFGRCVLAVANSTILQPK